MKTNFKKQTLFCALIVAMATGSCKKESTETLEVDKELSSLKTVKDADISAVYSSRSLNWNGRPTANYTLAQANTDFGNIMSGWNESRARIDNQMCRITLLKDALGAAGGMIAYVDILDGSEYEIQFDANFHSLFEFGLGGKMGWGFMIGDGASGGSDARDGQGGSLRLVWQESGGQNFFQAYAYHRDQADAYGTTYGRYPATGSISQSAWYTVKLYFKANTGSTTNGRLKMTINNTVVVDSQEALRMDV